MIWLIFLRELGRPEFATRLLLVLVVSSVLLVLYVFLGDPRVRVPFDPLVIVLATDGIARAMRAVTRTLAGRFAAAPSTGQAAP
jgi:hypothetical protein